MYCTKDCTCSLCRELRGYKPSDKKSAPSAPTLLSRMLNDNFILRRRGISLKNFQPQSLRNSEMLAQQMPVPRPRRRPRPRPSRSCLTGRLRIRRGQRSLTTKWSSTLGTPSTAVASNRRCPRPRNSTRSCCKRCPRNSRPAWRRRA